jgi:hypothetical protein
LNEIGARPHVCWQFTHYHHHRVIQKAATGENNPIAEQGVLAEPTMGWLATLLFLLGFSALDIIVKFDRRPDKTAAFPPAPSSSKW